MPWVDAGLGTTAYSDSPVHDINMFFGGLIHAGDLVVIGIASAPDSNGFVVTDSAAPGTFTWVFTSDVGIGIGAGEVAMAYAVATAPTVFAFITVTRVLSGGSAFGMAGMVYRHPGVPFTAETVYGRGNSAEPICGLLTPTAPGQLVVAWAGWLGTASLVGAISPLQTRLSLRFATVILGSMADYYPNEVAFAPSYVLDGVATWGMITTLFDATSPPVTPHPSSFLGSGLETFPMRRKTERREDSLRPQRRKRFTRDLLK